LGYLPYDGFQAINVKGMATKAARNNDNQAQANGRRGRERLPVMHFT
jgi:hypothetical protein